MYTKGEVRFAMSMTSLVFYLAGLLTSHTPISPRYVIIAMLIFIGVMFYLSIKDVYNEK